MVKLAVSVIESAAWSTTLVKEAQAELRPTQRIQLSSRSPLLTHCIGNVRRFMCCTVLTLASNFLVGYLKLLSVILFIFFFIMFYDSLRLPPYYHDAANLMNNAAGADRG